MTSHADCIHPRTKAARAKCRKDKAEIAKLWAEHELKNKAHHEAYIAPRERQEEAEAAWNEAFPKFAKAHQSSAHQNADDTSVEEGFEPGSTRWYQVALSTLESARADAEPIDWEDPQSGQAVDFVDHYRWVDRVIWAKLGGSKLILVDREGNRTEHPLIDLYSTRD